MRTELIPPKLEVLATGINDYLVPTRRLKFGLWKIRNHSKIQIRFYLEENTDMEQHYSSSIVIFVSEINFANVIAILSEIFAINVTKN